MFKQFCIVLFITIFCNGVAYSSSTKGISSDLISKEHAAATEAVSHINHKIEPNNTASDGGVHHIENHNVSTSANSSKIEDKPDSNVTAVEKIINQGSNTTNDTKTASDATIKSPNATIKSPDATIKSPNATIKSPDATIKSPDAIVSGSASNSPIPVVHASTATDLPPKIVSDMSRPIVAGQSTTTLTTLAVGTTIKAPVTMPTVVTPTPTSGVSTNTSNVVLVHNSSTKAQENRFDGASFVGGIVLTIGLTAIGFIAFKYYKSGYY